MMLQHQSAHNLDWLASPAHTPPQYDTAVERAQTPINAVQTADTTALLLVRISISMNV